MDKKGTQVGIAVALLAVGFVGGMQYGKASAPAPTSQRQFGQGGMMGARGTRGAGFAAGSILSKDASSITLSLQDGSSKIILLGSSTQIMKSTSGNASDLNTGETVTVQGTGNSDGSITAQSIQIRPMGMIRPQ